MLDIIEEAKFFELKEKCRELNVVPPPEIMINLSVVKDGKVLFKDVQRGHSWTRNFYNILHSFSSDCVTSGAASFGAGYMTARNTSGSITSTTSRSSGTVSSTNVSYRADVGTLQGIVVGTNDAVFSANNYSLGAIVNNGTSTGQLSYQASTISAPAYTAGTKVWETTLSRILNNNSGGSITVKEVGLYLGSCFYIGILGANNVWMTERSLLSPTVTIPDGAQLTVSYTISTSFSAID